MGMIALALIIIAGAWVYYRLALGRSETAARWPTVAGTITASRYQESPADSADGDGHVHYFANVAYRYVVGGKTFNCERIAFHGIDPHTRLLEVQTIVDRYPTGAVVRVRYNPDDPGEAVLEVRRPSRMTPLILTAAGLVLLVAGVWMTIR
ncbi:DUF3592 domain-containing protein [uncultured Brevundimonas sp.]|uniref:DUF3592 domain-containing protein n=1 Tax=uncultured Brevundimonas sp. TaxID=213418 RepID=UPI0030EF9549